jgi:uncharacterized protein DUF4402
VNALRAWHLAFVAALAALAVPRPAVAQFDSADARASIGVSIVSGFSVRKTQDLFVGALPTGQGAAAIDVPIGSSSVARFNVTGQAGGAVPFTVALPSSITIQRIGSGETMAVDGFRSSVSSESPGSVYTLLVGATLHVDANQRAGHYVGTFTVTVNQL